MSVASRQLRWMALTVLAAVIPAGGCGSGSHAQPCDLPGRYETSVTASASPTAATFGETPGEGNNAPTAGRIDPTQAIAARDLERATIAWAREVISIDTGELDELERDVCASRKGPDENQRRRYQDLLSQLRHALIVHERSQVSAEQARQFYANHAEWFRQQGTVRLKIIPWEGKRALAAKEITIDATTVRQNQEGSDEIIAAGLELEVGEMVTVTDREGNRTQVECLSKEPGTLVPFEEVMQAAAQQAAQQRVEEQIWERAKAVRATK